MKLCRYLVLVHSNLNLLQSLIQINHLPTSFFLETNPKKWSLEPSNYSKNPTTKKSPKCFNCLTPEAKVRISLYSGYIDASALA